MSESPIFDLLSEELGAADGTTAAAAQVIADVQGPGHAVQSARLATSLRDAGVLAVNPVLPKPDTCELYGNDDDAALVPYWFTPVGTVSAVGPESLVCCDVDGTEVAMDIAHAEDTAYAVLAAARYLRGTRGGK